MLDVLASLDSIRTTDLVIQVPVLPPFRSLSLRVFVCIYLLSGFQLPCRGNR